MATSTPIPELLTAELKSAIARASAAGNLGALKENEQLNNLKLSVEIPNDTTYGDYASPSALGMAKACRMAPRAIAEAIAAEIQLEDVDVSIAGPGFINFRLGPAYLQSQLQLILTLKENYGKTAASTPEKILLEFVSANPTGPLHVGHGRWAAIGSTLSNLLTWSGHKVDREYYINDAGNQMQNLGRSLQVRVQQQRGEQTELPEDGYRGSYLVEMAEKLTHADTHLETVEDYTEYAYRELLNWQKDTLHQLSTDFEQWFSERRLHVLDKDGKSEIDRTLEDLQQRDLLYKANAARQDEIVKAGAEEATYFKTGDFGDDKDRVVEKGDGKRTYLAADIAYHRDKLERGYDRLINILGSDHHGYIPRLKASVAAFDFDPDKLEVLLGQFVKLFHTNEGTGERKEVKMSKRSGNFVTLNDLIDDPEIGVGVDATRWFLLTNSADSQVNFDLDLAVKQSNDNPVFYVQYAHTRCCSLLRMAKEAGLELANPATIVDEDRALLFEEPEERKLLMSLLAVPEQLKRAAEERATHKVTRLAEAIAIDFHKFYDRCRILGSVLQEKPNLAKARLALVEATRQVLFNLLEGVLAIHAPTSM